MPIYILDSTPPKLQKKLFRILERAARKCITTLFFTKEPTITVWLNEIKGMEQL